MHPEFQAFLHIGIHRACNGATKSFETQYPNNGRKGKMKTCNEKTILNRGCVGPMFRQADLPFSRLEHNTSALVLRKNKSPCRNAGLSQSLFMYFFMNMVCVSILILAIPVPKQLSQ